MSLTRHVKTPKLHMWLQEARALWLLKKVDAATERAERVFKAEGREVFAASDGPLLEATLARIGANKKRKR